MSDNICGDYPIFCGWSPEDLTALSSGITTLAVIAGVFIAYWQLAGWRTERLGLRRAEIAEEMIALAKNAEDAFKHIRSRFDSIPKDKSNDHEYYFQRRYDRVMSYNDLFKSLRDAQIRIRAVVGNKKVDNAVDDLFRARGMVLAAIDILFDLAQDDYGADARDMRKKYKADMFGSFNKADKLGTTVVDAVALLEAELTPLARLEFK